MAKLMTACHSNCVVTEVALLLYCLQVVQGKHGALVGFPVHLGSFLSYFLSLQLPFLFYFLLPMSSLTQLDDTL